MGSIAGSLKAAASRTGISFTEYKSRIAAGEKRCWVCGEWKPRDDFQADKTRGDGLAAGCRSCRNDVHRLNHEIVPPEQRKPMGPARIARREGDQEQARSRINHDVRLGLRANPNALHCSLCGHKGDDRRHEYHHVMGYEAAHHYDVLPLCSSCHHGEH